MKGSFIQYLVGSIMVAFSLYQVYIRDFWEFALYAVAGSAFITMGLIKDKTFPNNERLMTILSWVLIAGTLFLFFFLVRTDG
ncbi:hypothetical protein E1176_09515 [Fulvivirga sp. RKSG066]|uniref:hypothetical protein n=1 Tax=Fulvivirga aurantia TaxID=2529383 RepID=UPI0012BD62E6|nr:hypothetical protein [Fulvivirga aurantia]MTI21257.1 hypothetical protein [Fulvivirga aurantia]